MSIVSTYLNSYHKTLLMEIREEICVDFWANSMWVQNESNQTNVKVLKKASLNCTYSIIIYIVKTNSSTSIDLKTRVNLRQSINCISTERTNQYIKTEPQHT